MNWLESWATSIVSYACSVVKGGYSMTSRFLEYLSYNACPEKPTIYYALKNMDMPAQDRTVIEQLLFYFWAIVGTLILNPIREINDIKFGNILFSPNYAFMPNGLPAAQPTVSMFEKMLIYIAENSSDIVEDKLMMHNIVIDNKDYDVPVDLWYTIKMKGDKKLYFYVHVSTNKNYRGVLFAAKKEDKNSLFETIKKKANDNYTKTLGKKVVVDEYSSDETISDIL